MAPVIGITAAPTTLIEDEGTLTTLTIRDTEAVVATLQGGAFYAPFIVADGTVEEALSGSKDVFFDFAAANPLGLDHVQKQGNQYRFEDLRGGDLDFNDAVFTVRTVAA
ncbi:DUF4114 domain-containing protein [Leptolyngbya sp. 7M]|uniref:DUF4114 domain-containing protein n=1 Tax=Leptolyngbya sp. 7M TaxID=2812896 RepID=UPI001B8AE1C7|nr:DUF4114 domain-containing protein [Leptolyngbya sp. 7M]QYO64766.1 DUF4114 domain-containing protein [Leptolyngbya sp. 7M]